MQKNKYKEIVEPELQDQTLFQLTQLKNFVDASIYNIASNDFEDDKQKIKYMLDALFNIRDFVLTATNSNSLRNSLIKAFEEADNEEKIKEALGNDQNKSENHVEE